MGVNVPKIKLGSQGLEVSKQGLGCMSMSAFYGPPKAEPDMIELIHHAINSGVTFLDTSDLYGPHTNEILVGKALKGGMREKVQIATKFGSAHEDGKMVVRGDLAYLKASCESSLKRLDIDCIDLYYVNGIDTRVPIEVTVREAGAYLKDSEKAEMYKKHKENPEVYTVEKLSKEYRIMRQRVHAILFLKEDEEEMEKKHGPLDDTCPE